MLAVVLVAACQESSGDDQDDVLKAAKRCGDGHCNPPETLLTCPTDCHPQSGLAGGESGLDGDGDESGISGRFIGDDEAEAGRDGAGAARGGASSSGRGGSGGSSVGNAGDDPGGAPSVDGGAGGKAGDDGPGQSGEGGAPEPAADRGIGASCTSTADCDAGLLCMTVNFFDGAGPAGGLCTAVCNDDAACQSMQSGSYCLPFTLDTSYCFEGCTTGTTRAPKCHTRAELACAPIGIVSTGVRCESDGDCGARQICSESEVCAAGLTACVPQCGSDADCESGGFCDEISGFCVPADPTGLPIGSACTPPDAGGLDPCDGYCEPMFSEEPVCQAFCAISASGHGCGWNGKGRAEAACLLPTIFTPPEEDPLGDLGYCALLCDCDADCEIAGDRCLDDQDGLIRETWARNGYCRPLLSDEDESITFPDCASTSGG